MLKIAVLSLLLGALALIAGLLLFFSPPTATGLQGPAVTLNATTAEVTLGTGTFSKGELQLEFNTAGASIVDFPGIQIQASAYPFLHLAIEESLENLQVSLIWQGGENGNGLYIYRLESASRKSLWLATKELDGWTGTIGSLKVVFNGRAGDTVRIRDFSLFPPSPSRQLQALYSDLTSYMPWNRAAMNSHTGVTKVSSLYPIPLSIAYLTLSMLFYGLVLLVYRATLKFNWRIVALIFLACWISLDMVWQNQLLHQLMDTNRTFSGKNTQEKLAVGPDAKLYNFVSQVKPLLEPKNARVFVSASDEYRGQRGAYFLYPFNVYWSEPRRPFPGNIFLHSGDYVVLINPTTLYFDPVRKTLKVPLAPHCCILNAELVLSDHTGTVVRVN